MQKLNAEPLGLCETDTNMQWLDNTFVTSWFS